MTNTDSLLLKRPIRVKVIVTPRWQTEVQEQLQQQISQLDSQLQQLDMQGQRAITELQNPSNLQASQQIEGIQRQVNQQKSQVLDKKNQALKQLQQIQNLEMGQEVLQGQMESFFNLQEGDNLVQKLNVEIVVEDGVVKEIRGQV